MTDRHIRRDGDDYAQALFSLLPTGPAWPRQPESVLSRVVAGLAAIWGLVDSRAADLLERETDPRATLDLLPEWERAWGLPDRCVAEPLGIDDRRAALLVKMTTLGGQSREFFISVAESIGYTIRIVEYAPFMVGISECGDTRDEDGSDRWEIGPAEMRFYWTVKVDAVRLTWFRVSVGQVGVDPHLRIALATDLECLFRRLKPAQTDVIFDYSGLTTPSPIISLMADLSDPNQSEAWAAFW